MMRLAALCLRRAPFAALPFALVAVSAPALAQSDVAISSVVMVERSDADGKVTLEKPQDVTVVPGDRLLFTLSYANTGSEPADNFVATNPMPGAVRFDTAREDWAELSVDGGRSWGKLADLTVTETAEDGTQTTRPATSEDVTHVRWVFTDPIAPGAKGDLEFHGTVR